MGKVKEMTVEEKQAEYRGRVESFLKELEPLLAKYNLGVDAEIQAMANGFICKPVFPSKSVVLEK